MNVDYVHVTLDRAHALTAVNLFSLKQIFYIAMS